MKEILEREINARMIKLYSLFHFKLDLSSHIILCELVIKIFKIKNCKKVICKFLLIEDSLTSN